ncbi:4932_t:CDS:10 [Entrophospora sp. SA101]|nr:4932_t:CDS:10 [Entrophospora sp. SA101]
MSDNVGKAALKIQTYHQPCVLCVLETTGQDGEGFLLVYSISSHSTFEQVKRFKDQMIRIKGSNKIPSILVGNKCERHTECEVLSEEGMNMTKRLGCGFFESSTKTFVEMIEQKGEKWFKNQLKREHILFLDYNSFQNIKIIDGGSFGTISCAYSKHHQGFVALKSINVDQKYTFQQLLNEAIQHLKVEHHSNILRFYGITKEKYANNGNLCDYLKYNFNIMDWNIKLKFAKQIVSAVRHLHENKIVHRDLHSKNILIHNGNIKICDFGISKFLLDPSIEASKRLGTIRYSDPEYLNNAENYSEREAIIKGTPRKYAEIYTACWQGNPDLRPYIHQVMQDLDKVDITDTIEDIVISTDQTFNELQNDDSLHTNELPLSARINSLNNHLND